MGIYLKTTCVCGATNVSVDVFDYDDFTANYGVTCSDACRSIWDTRVSWSADYDYDYALGQFGVAQPLPLFASI